MNLATIESTVLPPLLANLSSNLAQANVSVGASRMDDAGANVSQCRAYLESMTVEAANLGTVRMAARYMCELVLVGTDATDANVVAVLEALAEVHADTNINLEDSLWSVTPEDVSAVPYEGISQDRSVMFALVLRGPGTP